MNTKMLKYLVDLSIKPSGYVDVEEFLKRYPDTPQLRRELKTLMDSCYLMVIYADDEIDTINVDRAGYKHFS